MNTKKCFRNSMTAVFTSAVLLAASGLAGSANAEEGRIKVDNNSFK